MGNVLKYKYIPATQRSSLILKIGLSTVVDDSFKYTAKYSKYGTQNDINKKKPNRRISNINESFFTHVL